MMPDRASFHVADPRDGDATLDITFVIESYGYAAITSGPVEACDPGEPPEITIETAEDEEGDDVFALLTDEQKDQVEAIIFDRFDFGAERRAQDEADELAWAGL